MGASKETQTQHQEQTRDPYAPAVPGLNMALQGAMNTYKSGVGSQVYGGPRVAGSGAMTDAGMLELARNRNVGMDAVRQGSGYVGGLLQNGGSTADGRNAVNGLLAVPGASTGGLASAAARMGDPNSTAASAGRSLTGGDFNLDATGFNGLNAGLAGPSQTRQSLLDIANGKFLGQANPYTDEMIAQGGADALNSVKGAFSASGRYGSGMFASAAADAVSRNANALRYQDYDQERARQAQAAGAIDSADLARTGMRSSLYGAANDTRSANANQLVAGAGLTSGADAAALQGAQALYGASAANAQQRIGQFQSALGASQSDRAASLAGIAAIPGLQSAALRPGQTLAAIGAAKDAEAQQRFDARQQVFNERQSAPWRSLGLLSSIVDPIAGAGGRTTGDATTQQIQDPGMMNSILGGVMGLGGTAAKLGSAAPGLMSLGSAMAPLFALSDERSKEDIEPVGKLDDGQTVYKFRYKGDPKTQIGLLAQEVEDREPGAVVEGADGLKRVDYDEATRAAARKKRGDRPAAGDTEFDKREVLADMIGKLLGEDPEALEAPASGFNHPAFASPFVDPEHNAMFAMDRQAGRRGRARQAA